MLVHSLYLAQVSLNGRELAGILIAGLGLILVALTFLKVVLVPVPKVEGPIEIKERRERGALLQFITGVVFIVAGLWVGGFLPDSEGVLPVTSGSDGQFTLGEEVITCEVVNVSLKNGSTKKVNTFREMKDKDGNVVAKNEEPQPPDGYANLGWRPPADYSGSITWVILFTDQQTGKELYRYEDFSKLDCP